MRPTGLGLVAAVVSAAVVTGCSSATRDPGVLVGTGVPCPGPAGHASQFAELAVVVSTPKGRVVADLSYLGRPYRFKLGLPPGRYLARSLNNPAVVANVRSGTTTRVVLPQSCG